MHSSAVGRYGYVIYLTSNIYLQYVLAVCCLSTDAASAVFLNIGKVQIYKC